MPATLLMIPGLAADHRMWDPMEPELRDLPHGLVAEVATAHSAASSIETMAAALLARHAGELVLCGASMGGMVALEMQRQAPERVRAMALLGTVAHGETADMHALRSAAIVEFEQGRAEAILRTNVALAFHPDNASRLAETYVQMILGAGVGTLVRHNRAVMARPDALARLASVRCPVLVLCGEADQLTPPICSEQIAAALPNAHRALVEGAGHMLTMEQPGAVGARLRAWLQASAEGSSSAT